MKITVPGAVGICLFILIVIAGCAVDEVKLAQEQEERAGRKTCSAYQELRKDFRSGIVTKAEFRERMQKIDHYAQDAETTIRDKARDLFRAITQEPSTPWHDTSFEDIAPRVRAMGDLDDACVDAGYLEWVAPSRGNP